MGRSIESTQQAVLSPEVVKDVIKKTLEVVTKPKKNQRWPGGLETGNLWAANILFRVKNVLANLSMNLQCIAIRKCLFYFSLKTLQAILLNRVASTC